MNNPLQIPNYFKNKLQVGASAILQSAYFSKLIYENPHNPLSSHEKERKVSWRNTGRYFKLLILLAIIWSVNIAIYGGFGILLYLGLVFLTNLLNFSIWSVTLEDWNFLLIIFIWTYLNSVITKIIDFESIEEPNKPIRWFYFYLYSFILMAILLGIHVWFSNYNWYLEKMNFRGLSLICLGSSYFFVTLSLFAHENLYLANLTAKYKKLLESPPNTEDNEFSSHKKYCAVREEYPYLFKDSLLASGLYGIGFFIFVFYVLYYLFEISPTKPFHGNTVEIDFGIFLIVFLVWLTLDRSMWLKRRYKEPPSLGYSSSSGDTIEENTVERAYWKDDIRLTEILHHHLLITSHNVKFPHNDVCSGRKVCHELEYTPVEIHQNESIGLNQNISGVFIEDSRSSEYFVTGYLEDDFDSGSISEDGRKYIITISYRGTQESSDVGTNLAVIGSKYTFGGTVNKEGRIHNGYYRSARYSLFFAQQAIKQYLNQYHRKSKDKDLKLEIRFTGHSLGGGIATVAYILFKNCIVEDQDDQNCVLINNYHSSESFKTGLFQRLDPQDWINHQIPDSVAHKIKKDDLSLKLITFAAPMVVDDVGECFLQETSLFEDIDLSVFSFIRFMDAVPRVPPSLLFWFRFYRRAPNVILTSFFHRVSLNTKLEDLTCATGELRAWYSEVHHSEKYMETTGCSLLDTSEVDNREGITSHANDVIPKKGYFDLRGFLEFSAESLIEGFVPLTLWDYVFNRDYPFSAMHSMQGYLHDINWLLRML